MRKCFVYIFTVFTSFTSFSFLCCFPAFLCAPLGHHLFFMRSSGLDSADCVWHNVAGRTSIFLLSYDMVFFITTCRLLSWLAWYEHRQQLHSSFLSSATDLSAVSRENRDSGRQWMVDSDSCATVASWSVCQGQHSQCQSLRTVQCATCMGIDDEPSRPVIIEQLSTSTTCQSHAWDANQATALTSRLAFDIHGQ